MKIIEYALCTKGDRGESLKDQVNAAIEDGWQPLGGVSISADSTGGVLAQAMVKYEEGNVIPEKPKPKPTIPNRRTA